MAPDAATDVQPTQPVDATNPVGINVPAAPAPNFPTNDPNNPKVGVDTPAPPQGNAPGAQIPKQSFREGMAAADAGFHVDEATGHLVSNAPVRQHSLKGALGQILVGALAGIQAGASAQTEPGAKGRGAAFSAGSLAADRAAQAKVAAQKQQAEADYDRQRQMVDDKLRHNLQLAQLHDYYLKDEHEEADIREAGARTDALVQQNLATHDQRGQAFANMAERINEESQKGGIQAVMISPNDQAALQPNLPALVGKQAYAIPNGQSGPDRKMLMVSAADMEQPIPKGVSIDIPLYTGVYDTATGKWQTSTDKHVIQGDGKTTWVAAYNALMASDKHLTDLQTAANQRHAQENAGKPDLDSISANPEKITPTTAPGLVSSMDSILNDPKADPEDKAKAARIKTQAQQTLNIAAQQKASESATDAAIKAGDPKAAGQLLATNDTTISELKSRGMTPQYIQQAIAEAKRINPDYNAVAADNYAKTAGAEANNQFFGNVGSLLAPTGTVSQLLDAGSQISQDDWNVLNKVKNWTDFQTGKANVSGYAAIAVGVADDYAKVMGGSVGSDAARNLVLQLIDPNASPAQRAEAARRIQGAVRSQAESRIGQNPFLQKMYGNLVNPDQTGQAGGQPQFKRNAF